MRTYIRAHTASPARLPPDGGIWLSVPSSEVGMRPREPAASVFPDAVPPGTWAAYPAANSPVHLAAHRQNTNSPVRLAAHRQNTNSPVRFAAPRQNTNSPVRLAAPPDAVCAGGVSRRKFSRPPHRASAKHKFSRPPRRSSAGRRKIRKNRPQLLTSGDFL